MPPDFVQDARDATLLTIINELAPLPQEDRERIIRTVAVYFNMEPKENR
jgi:hypothetical protein